MLVPPPQDADSIDVKAMCSIFHYIPTPLQTSYVRLLTHGSYLYKGGGSQGATMGLLEYLSQSNDCADGVSESERFRFLTISQYYKS